MAVLRSLLLMPMRVFIGAEQIGQVGDCQDKGSAGSQGTCLFKVGSWRRPQVFKRDSAFTGISPPSPNPATWTCHTQFFSPVRALSSHTQAPERAVSGIRLAASMTAF